MLKNCPKVAIYARFELKMGLGLKFPEKLTPVQLHSSHGDPFRDQKSFFLNQGVNKGSNFPGPTPKTKVAPNPIFPKNMFGVFV